jgi:rSAM/selenodomain-associated transferase 1
MSRAPIAGQTKTRLESHLDSEQCAQLHSAFLKDIGQMLLQVAQEYDINLYLSYTPPGKEDLFADLIPEEFEFFLQQGSDLGAKMNHALNYVGQENEQQIIIGSDLPALQPSVLREVIELLGTNDIVLGPSQDGGYYLCATKDCCPFLFDDIVWGQEQVLAATIEQINSQSDLEYDLAVSCGDIDFYSELLELKEKLASPAQWEFYPAHTAKVIEQLKIDN